MANLIQIKRSDATSDPANTDLVSGELAYSYVTSSNSLFIGNDGDVPPIRIGGGKYLWLHQSNTSSPGAATANAVVITNGNGYITALKSNELRVGDDGTSVAIANISTFANTTQLGGSAGGSNTELVTSWAIKNYIDSNAPALPNTYVAFGANSVANGGVSTFTYVDANSTLTVTNVIVSDSLTVTGNTVLNGGVVIGSDATDHIQVVGKVNTHIIPFDTQSYTLGNSSFTWHSVYVDHVVSGDVDNTGTLATGNTTVTGFVNVSSYGTFGGTVNAAALNVSGVVTSGNTTVTGFANISGTVAAGNTTVTGFVNASSYGTFGGAVNATSFNTSGVVTAGNTTVTGFINVSSYGTFGGTVNAAAGNITNNLGVGGNLTVSGTTGSGNTTISGFANVTTSLQVGGDATIGGNAVISGVANVAQDVNVGGDLSVAGNLTVSGTLTTISTNNLVIEDSMISLADQNSGDAVDVGFYATYNDGDTKYTGLFRDATEQTYKLFQGLTVQPTLTVDVANASFTYGTLQSHIKAGGDLANGFIANSTTIAITATSSLNVAIVANTLTLSTALGGTSGGTGLAAYTAEDLLVANSTNGFRKLSAGANGTVLQVTGGVVAYGTLDGGTF